MKNTICLLLLSMVFMGCATSYRPIMVQQPSYPHEYDSAGLTMAYRYEVLKPAGNRKYAKKELRSNVRLIAVKFTNNTDQPLKFGQDVEIYTSNGTLRTPLKPLEVKRHIRQVSGLYMLWGLFWINLSGDCTNGDCNTTPIPAGLAIGLANMAIASGANKNFVRDLTFHSLIDKTVDPGETVYGIVPLIVRSGQPLELRRKSN